MLLLEQVLPQPPQFAGSPLEELSQPLVSLLLSQSAKPALQVPLHAPPAQVGVAMLLPEHAMPQPPQFAGLSPVEVSQPFESLLLSQSAKPALQAPLQVPPAQVGIAMLLLEQLLPQPPQFAGSLLVSVHGGASEPTSCAASLASLAASWLMSWLASRAPSGWLLASGWEASVPEPPAPPEAPPLPAAPAEPHD
jgi:hypothetical protein